MAKGKSDRKHLQSTALVVQSARNRRRRQKAHFAETGVHKLLDGLHIDQLELRELQRNPRNARTHSKRQISLLKASIKHFGWLVPILCDENYQILAGHGRCEAARELGLTTVPVIIVSHLSDEDKRLYALADNRLAELSGWSQEILKIELQELSVPALQLNLEITGFETADIDRVMDIAPPPVDDPADAVPPAPARPVSRLDDVFVLGDHRLLCGNALEARSYARLLGNERAQMVMTDPPYNVAIRGHARARGARHREFEMASGEMSSDEFQGFLSTNLQLIRNSCSDGAIVFVCMDHAHALELLAAAYPLFGKHKQLCVWVKDNAGLGTFYRSQHELVFAFKVGSAPHINNFGLGENGRYRTNVWQHRGANSLGASRAKTLAMHPTVKPCSLVVDAIKDCSHRNGIILDPFAGSGTAAIAAERTGRRARLIELDPAYVDVAVKRWEEFTGKEAIHQDSGMTFAQLAKARAAEGGRS